MPHHYDTFSFIFHMSVVLPKPFQKAIRGLPIQNSVVNLKKNNLWIYLQQSRTKRGFSFSTNQQLTDDQIQCV